MTENMESPILDDLRHIRAGQDAVQVHVQIAELSVRVDRLSNRVERIETRLGLIEV